MHLITFVHYTAENSVNLKQLLTTIANPFGWDKVLKVAFSPYASLALIKI